MNNLVIAEKQRLQELEGIISSGMRTVFEVGRALQEIRVSRLYRETHATFEDYCRDKLDMTHQHADRLIGSSRVIENLTPIGVKPLTESQARPLTKLLPEQQVQAWQIVVETAPEGKITARLVNKVVKTMIQDETEQKTKRIIKAVEVVRVHPDFEKAYRNFYREVQNAKLNKWRETSKEEALRLVNNIIDLITIS